MEKICIICKQTFQKPYYCCKKEWSNRKYCSRKCKGRDDSLRLLGNNFGFKKGNPPWNKGKHPEYMQGENNPQWKGNQVGYLALHNWVSYHRGTPRKCEKCGTLTAKKYEWTNISREYKRDLKDFQRLCVSCHRKDGFLKGELKRNHYFRNKKTGLNSIL